MRGENPRGFVRGRVASEAIEPPACHRHFILMAAKIIPHLPPKTNSLFRGFVFNIFAIYLADDHQFLKLYLSLKNILSMVFCVIAHLIAIEYEMLGLIKVFVLIWSKASNAKHSSIK